jgi:hypothetical protein
MSLRFPMLLAAAAFAAAALLQGCRVERDEYAGFLAPPPDFVRAAAARGDFARVVAYARTLPYDTLPGSGDRQRLMVGKHCSPWSRDSDCRYGALVTIQPERDSWRIPDTLDLARGRVVARLTTADSSYAKLNVWPSDTTYWWVDRAREGGKWRAVLLSSRAGRPPVVRGALWHPSERGGARVWRQGIARFEWSDTDEELWATCLILGCCRLGDFDVM